MLFIDIDNCAGGKDFPRGLFGRRRERAGGNSSISPIGNRGIRFANGFADGFVFWQGAIFEETVGMEGYFLFDTTTLVLI